MTKIGFFGAGRMATAMIRGLLKSNCYSANEIACISTTGNSAQRLAKETGIRVVNEATHLIQSSSIIVLAFKPKNLADFSAQFDETDTPRLVISVLGGTSLVTLKGRLKGSYELVRIMPNIPCEVGAGYTPYTPANPLSPTNAALLDDFLKALGTSILISEADLDRSTRITGCGPAYFYELTDALAKAGEASGLSPSLAQTFARATLIGAGRLLEESGRAPTTLRDEVASPGGITEKMLSLMNEAQFRNLIEKIVTTPHN